ncbi:unnamed protein product [Aphanomyces euteiches]
MEEEFDEEFGDDVLPSTSTGAAPSTSSVGNNSATYAPSASGSTTTSTSVKVEEEEEEEDGTSVLYGNMKENSAKPVDQEEEEEEEELEEEDEAIAIVLKDSTDTSPSKPQLRFTRGDNRYVRGTGAGGDPASIVSPQLQPSAPRPHEQFDPSFDELALLGIGGRRTAFDVDIDALDDKPWRKPGVDISDYFNYGFDEATWREYCIKQQQNRRELAYKKAQEKEAEEKEKAKAAAAAASEMTAYMPPMGGGPGRGPPPPHMMFRGGMPPPRGPGGWNGAPPPWAQGGGSGGYVDFVQVQELVGSSFSKKTTANAVDQADLDRVIEIVANETEVETEATEIEGAVDVIVNQKAELRIDPLPENA